MIAQLEEHAKLKHPTNDKAWMNAFTSSLSRQLRAPLHEETRTLFVTGAAGGAAGAVALFFCAATRDHPLSAQLYSGLRATLHISMNEADEAARRDGGDATSMDAAKGSVLEVQLAYALVRGILSLGEGGFGRTEHYRLLDVLRDGLNRESAAILQVVPSVPQIICELVDLMLTFVRRGQLWRKLYPASIPAAPPGRKRGGDGGGQDL